ncbi:DUF1987 domain-containing protein [Fundidesulfovibrio butyratiphilus]
MNTLTLEAGPRSPEVSFDFTTNVYSLKGESYPEDVNEFYGEMLGRLEKHLEAFSGATVRFTFELVYFNSSTAKVLMSLFELLDEAAGRGNTVEVIWVYQEDDEKMMRT